MLKAYKFKGEFDDDIFYIKAENEKEAIKEAKNFWEEDNVTLIGEISDEEEKDVFWF